MKEDAYVIIEVRNETRILAATYPVFLMSLCRAIRQLKKSPVYQKVSLYLYLTSDSNSKESTKDFLQLMNDFS